jgi:hypothetical protein
MHFAHRAPAGHSKVLAGAEAATAARLRDRGSLKLTCAAAS